MRGTCPSSGCRHLLPPYEQNFPSFIDIIRSRMAGIARGSRTEQQWAGIHEGFHAHVLVWERESLILPVADRLGLGKAVMDVYSARRAAEAVGELFRGLGKRRKYDKAIDGPEFLQRIADDIQLRTIVIESNPSLRSIVEELVSL
ncbi:hypothetical protein Q664_07535 [Archangium violaceum Cb vi76]|uniref:Uncharacterized protein n=1 Tax=Archangium violaceum Cb vi76 TaxID=1406225 RepID=A0A084SYS7_9BACT|nr:hypothetical protein Q664_07535 [Archangium violaceum Cb vi76]